MKVETAPKSKIYRNKTGMFRKCDLVTSHIGRKSYATNFYEIMPAYLVMNNTGHTTEQQLLTYLKVDSKAKANETHNYYKTKIIKESDDKNKWTIDTVIKEDKRIFTTSNK